MKSFKWQLLQWCTCSLQHLSDTENYKSEVLRYLNTRRPSLKPRLMKSCPLPFSPGSWRKRCVKIDQWPAGLESSLSQIGHIGTNGVTVQKNPGSVRTTEVASGFCTVDTLVFLFSLFFHWFDWFIVLHCWGVLLLYVLHWLFYIWDCNFIIYCSVFIYVYIFLLLFHLSLTILLLFIFYYH